MDEPYEPANRCRSDSGWSVESRFENSLNNLVHFIRNTWSDYHLQEYTPPANRGHGSLPLRRTHLSNPPG
jgi:hypothetical protein